MAVDLATPLSVQEANTTAEDENSDAEWEYEYDENETESFFFTVDISAHSVIQPTHTGPGPRSKKRKREMEPAATDLLDVTEKGATESADPQNNRLSGPRHLQILDLDTTGPILKVGNDIYTAEWTDDLGTQIFLSAAGTTESPERPGFKVDVVALSRARLVARPVTLLPKVRAEPTHGSSEQTPIMISDGPEDGKQHDREADLSSASRAAFLRRLAEIKRARGETDEVPLSGMRERQVS